jgi:protein SCO1/2
MKLVQSFRLVMFATALAAFGCRQAAEQPAGKQYEISGKVVAVDAQKRTVTLDHEDIPGLMQGMEMEFAVDDPSALEGIKPGDQVQGRLRVEDGDYTITSLEGR